MGKRIWKKPGSKAWKEAINKSAGRMAWDLLRVPVQQRKQVLDRYAANKGNSTRDAVTALVRAIERAPKEGTAAEIATAKAREFQAFFELARDIARGVNDNERAAIAAVSLGRSGLRDMQRALRGMNIYLQYLSGMLRNAKQADTFSRVDGGLGAAKLKENRRTIRDLQKKFRAAQEAQRILARMIQQMRGREQ